MEIGRLSMYVRIGLKILEGRKVVMMQASFLGVFFYIYLFGGQGERGIVRQIFGPWRLVY